MDYLQLGFLGLLQGVFEWLPISSSGNVMLAAYNLFHIPAETAFSLGLYLHIGTMAAVLIKYRKTWLNLLNDKKLLNFILISWVFGGITGVICYVLTKVLLTSFNGDHINGAVGLLLVITGLVLTKTGGYGIKTKKDIEVADSIYVGLSQGIAILPGISRSATTIFTLVFRGYTMESAFNLSFLISVPAVASATIFEAATEGVSTAPFGPLIFGILVALVVGYLTIEVILESSKKLNLAAFCIIFGLLAMTSSVFL